MIHTAKFYSVLSVEDIQNLEKKFNEEVTLLDTILNNFCDGISVTFIYNKFQKCYFTFIFVDFVKLLRRANIVDEDYEIVETKLNEFIRTVFDKELELTLVRVDYRYDVKLKKEDRLELIKILRKTHEKFRFMKKYDTYDTSIYFNSGSVQTIIYDKEEQKKKSFEAIEEYEKDILRFEVRLQNGHINYMKHKYNLFLISFVY